MSHSDGNITAPVSIYDVQHVLGNNSSDVGTLCRASNINKWSKYKPVIKNLIDTVTGQINPTTKAWLGTATWWKGTSGTCGFDSVSVLMDTPSNIAYNSINSGGMWSYQNPNGGQSAPYRLTDFAGYNHNAVCPFKIVPPASFGVGAAGSVTVYFNDFVPGFIESHNLGLGDLINMNTYALWRPTLAIVNPDNDNVVRYFFSQNRFNDMPSSGFEIQMSGLQNILTVNKTYIGVVMLSNYDTDIYGNVPAEGVASEWTGAQAFSCSFEDGIDNFSAIYKQSGYVPGGNPSTDSGTWYYAKYMELYHQGITGEAAKFDIYGLEFWVQPKTNGVPDANYVNVENMDFKVTAVIHDGYDYDDTSQGGTFDPNNLYGSKELLIVDWTHAVIGTNTDWDTDPLHPENNAYILELGNYIYQAINGNVHDAVYLDKDSFPHDVTFNLHMRVRTAPGTEYVVCSFTMSLSNATSDATINNQTPQ